MSPILKIDPTKSLAAADPSDTDAELMLQQVDFTLEPEDELYHACFENDRALKAAIEVAEYQSVKQLAFVDPDYQVIVDVTAWKPEYREESCKVGELVIQAGTGGCFKNREVIRVTCRHKKTVAGRELWTFRAEVAHAEKKA